MEPWQLYGGRYREVDFSQPWAYTPRRKMVELPDEEVEGGGVDERQLELGQEQEKEQDRGQEEEGGDEDVGGNAEGQDDSDGSLESGGTARQLPAPPSDGRGRKSAHPLVYMKKWFSAVRGSLRRRKVLEESGAGVSSSESPSGSVGESAGENVVESAVEGAVEGAVESAVESGGEVSSSRSEELPRRLESRRRRERWMEWEVALWEWKAWGYYARPWVNDVFVKNYPPAKDIPENVDVEELARSLVDSHGTEHPERWIAGVQHPSLPPRPLRWASDPHPGLNPLPWQCQLNPYLRRKVVGIPAIFWDVGRDPATMAHGHTAYATPLLPSDFAQPATWPFCTHMHVSALADDVEFPWPFIVINKKGITCQDVYDTIYENFQQYVWKEEWDEWPMFRREMAVISYDKRKGEDGLKRIDYLGFHSMFRGLEASPDGRSWFLFVGRPW
ncbi:hypothetical protein AX17_006539 [Amanita inopinata Kibby_2008]|nr:hypothetical protein AX17_006539 [Amanita inopinata Kibby_2008]